MRSYSRLVLAAIFALQFPLSVLHSEFAYAKGKAASKNDTEEAEPIIAPSTDHTDDDDGDGDPYLRYQHATMKDQNCDPTFLLDLYKKFHSVNCMIHFTGYCVDPTWADDGMYGLAAGGGAAIGRVSYKYGGDGLASLRSEMSSLKAGQTALQEQVAILRMAKATEAVVGGAEMAGVGLTPTPSSIAVTTAEAAAEKMAEEDIGAIILRGTLRAGRNLGEGVIIGALIGFGVTFIYSLGNSEYGAAFAQWFHQTASSKTACDGIEATDRDFQKYVPIMPGTCMTAIYAPAHKKVLAFLDLPVEKKLAILKKNRLVCGYYKGLDKELEQRINAMNGDSDIKNVTCNHGSGDITFQLLQQDPEVNFKIRRDPRSKDFLSYSYEEREVGVKTNAATFDLTKQDDESVLVSKTRVYNSVSQTDEVITNDKLERFSVVQATKAQDVFTAFRTLRKFARTVALCCDIPVPMEKEKLKAKPNAERVRHESSNAETYDGVCHPAWFNRSAGRLSPSSTTAH